MKKFLIIAFIAIPSYYFVTDVISQQQSLADIYQQRVDSYNDIGEIDQQIRFLEDEKMKHTSRALRFTDKANRWQFQSNLSLEAKRAYAMADEEKLKAAEAELEIKLLQKRKQQLLKGRSQ